MKRLVAVVFALALASPAFAGQCPTIIKQIDEKLAMAQVSDADKAKIQELRNKGEQEHAAGNHAAAEAAVNEAMALLQ